MPTSEREHAMRDSVPAQSLRHRLDHFRRDEPVVGAGGEDHVAAAEPVGDLGQIEVRRDFTAPAHQPMHPCAAPGRPPAGGGGPLREPECRDARRPLREPEGVGHRVEVPDVVTDVRQPVLTCHPRGADPAMLGVHVEPVERLGCDDAA
jgi:hypothetical protein